MSFLDRHCRCSIFLGSSGAADDLTTGKHAVGSTALLAVFGCRARCRLDTMVRDSGVRSPDRDD